MKSKIRELLDKYGRLQVPADHLADDQDLYAVGLTSFAAVQLMLALEEAFNMEFPERMLKRSSFASIAAIADCLHQMEPQALAS